jgi:hypothetical protein
MKNFFKARIAPVLGIIALVAVIGLSFAACDDGNGNGGGEGDRGPIPAEFRGEWYCETSSYYSNPCDYHLKITASTFEINTRDRGTAEWDPEQYYIHTITRIEEEEAEWGEIRYKFYDSSDKYAEFGVYEDQYNNSGEKTLFIYFDFNSDDPYDALAGISAYTNYPRASFTKFVAVTDITSVPTTTTSGSALRLTVTIEPDTASNQAIIWTVKSAGTTGATISSTIYGAIVVNNLNTTAAGTVTVTATIAGGKALGTDYAKDFTITVGVGKPEWPEEFIFRTAPQSSQWGKTSYPNPQNIGFYYASDGDGRKTAYMNFEPGGDQRGYDLTKIEGKTLTVTTGVGPSGQTTTYILCTNWTIENNNLTLSGGDAHFSSVMNTPLRKDL